MQIFYCWTRDTARSIAEKIVEYDPSAREVKVCTAALRLMLQVLNWEFQFNTGSTRSLNVYSTSTRQDAALTNRTECVLVQVCLMYKHLACIPDVITMKDGTIFLSCPAE